MALARRCPNLSLHIQLPHEEIKETPKLLPSSIVTNQSMFDHYEKLEILGFGNGGNVYKVRHSHTGDFHALKVMHADTTSEEIQIHSFINSPFIVECHGVSVDSSGEVSLLMEFMDGGSLYNLAKINGPFTEDIIANIANQVLMGLDYLHKNKIVHQDVKPSNLLVNKKMQVKIADFGISKVVTCENRSFCNGHIGTYAYMSPERFDSETYGFGPYGGDVWSLGLTLMELYIGHHPYVEHGQKADGTTLMWAICFDEVPTLPEDASANFRDFIHCCLQKDWRKRWTTSQLLSHPFVAGKT